MYRNPALRRGFRNIDCGRGSGRCWRPDRVSSLSNWTLSVTEDFRTRRSPSPSATARRSSPASRSHPGCTGTGMYANDPRTLPVLTSPNRLNVRNGSVAGPAPARTSPSRTIPIRPGARPPRTSGTSVADAPLRPRAAAGGELAGQARPLLEVGEQFPGHLDAVREQLAEQLGRDDVRLAASGKHAVRRAVPRTTGRRRAGSGRADVTTQRRAGAARLRAGHPPTGQLDDLVEAERPVRRRMNRRKSPAPNARSLVHATGRGFRRARDPHGGGAW